MKRLSFLQKIGLIVVFAFAAFYLGIAAVTEFVVSQVYMPKIHAMSENVSAHHADILKDLELLDANPIFAESLRSRDAQGFISRHIEWEGRNVEALLTPEHQKLVALKARHSKLNDIENIKKLSEDHAAAVLDVSWVDQLESYDHWNLSTNPVVKMNLTRVRQLNGMGRIGVFGTMPMPNFTLLEFASVVRCLQLQKRGDPLLGLHLLRHVSYLAHTTPTLIGAMIATAGLNHERTIVDAFGITNWKPIDKERIAAFKRVSWGWGGLIHEANWDNLPSEFSAFIKPSNGVCAMAGESVLGIGFQDFLAPTLPFESNFSEKIHQSSEFTRKLLVACSMPEYAVYLEPSPAESNPMFGKGFNSVWTFASIDETTAINESVGINPARIPFARRALGMLLMTIAIPDYLKQYEDRMPASSGLIGKPNTPATGG